MRRLSLVVGLILSPLALAEPVDAAWNGHAEAGRILCGYGHFASSDDLCANLMPTEEARNHVWFERADQEPTHSLIVEVVWDSYSTTAPTRIRAFLSPPPLEEVTVTTMFGSDAEYEPAASSVVGSSPIRLRMDAPPGLELYPGGYEPRFNVALRAYSTTTDRVQGDPAGEARAVGIQYDAKFQAAVTWLTDEEVEPYYSYFNPTTWPDAVRSEVPLEEPQKEPASTPEVADPATRAADGDPGPASGPSTRLAGSLEARAWMAWSAAASLAGVAAWGGRRVLLAGLVTLFSRVRSDEALEHPTRSLLDALVRAEPGLTRAEARRRLGLGRAAFEHHARVLERCGHLRLVREFGVVRLVPPASAHPAPLEARTIPGRLIHLLRARPGLRPSEAARSLGVPETTLSYHATTLLRQGLLERRAAGRDVRYFTPSF